MERTLHEFNPWWDGKFEFPGVSRKDYLDALLKLTNSNDVVLVTGLRRVGKTTLMRQVIHKLLEKVNAKMIFYVSLDNIALREHTILEVVDEFRKLNGLKHNERVYLFLDEVHLKEDYELQLKNLYDSGNAKVYASGSSSLDIIMKSPALTGRQRIIRVSPLNFREYLRFVNVDVSAADSHLYPSLAQDYLESGGLPEFVKTKDLNYIQSLIDSILYRDIAGRHGIRNRENLLDILVLLAQSVGTTMSLRKISRVLGMPLETVSSIIDHFVEANLIHMVEREGKVSERKASPRKMYLADTGLFLALTEKVNTGSKVENLVYLVLRKRGVVRYHRASGREVDFIQKKDAWESKYKDDFSKEELGAIRGLRGMKSRTVVTKEREGKDGSVIFLPLWKLLLDDGI